MSTDRDTAGQVTDGGQREAEKKPAARPKARVRARATNGGSATKESAVVAGKSAARPAASKRASSRKKPVASAVRTEAVATSSPAMMSEAAASSEAALERPSTGKKRVTAKAAGAPRGGKASARASIGRRSNATSGKVAGSKKAVSGKAVSGKGVSGKGVVGSASVAVTDATASSPHAAASDAAALSQPAAVTPKANGVASEGHAGRPKVSSRRATASSAKVSAKKSTAERAVLSAASSAAKTARTKTRPSTEAATSTGVPEVEAQPVEGEARSVRAATEAMPGLDAQLESIVRDVTGSDDEAERRARAAAALRDIAARLHHPPPSDSPEAGGFGSARSILRTDHYLRQWGRLAMRGRVQDVDDFGFDPAYEAKAAPVLNALYRQWFRVEVKGLEHVPESGGAMLVSNHSGTLPWDGLMLNRALRLEHPRGSMRWLIDDLFFHMPFVGSSLTRLGAVRACPDNAERVLKNGEALAVFPEGLKGLGKLYKQRYKLQRFGRGGYVRLALRAQVPVLPVAIVGAEESMPLLFKVNRLSRGFGLPYIPVTPTFPALGPLGLLPAPTKWHIQIGPPVSLEGAGPDRADDAVLVNRLNERIRTQIQEMVDHNVRLRDSVFR